MRSAIGRRSAWSGCSLRRFHGFARGCRFGLPEGVLFTTYATLRTDERGEKLSRVRQIVEWLGSDFDGVIVFDESHAMQNAVGGKGERRDHAASQQGRAGLRLQHALPNARVVYVSATGATTVHNLAYAQRLGLWGGDDFPFATRAEFVEAIEEGGVAAMEVLARDLKALGLYAARSLSYEGVEYELIEHQLTPEQVCIYEAYAGAFSIIHNNLDAAMRAANITGETGTLNAQAKSAARSAFESAKQRFFGHLLTSMKTPSLIRSIERDRDAGHAAVIQIVSTGEALMERRLAEAWVTAATETGTPNLTPDAAFTALLDGKTIVDLTETLQRRHVRVMGVNRIELIGFTDAMRDRLRAYGLFGEIISWKLRFFVPVDATGPAILTKVLQCYPVVRVVNRAAA